MGNTYAGASNSSEVLILSFPLDADYDTCQMPCICPRKKPMFHPPSCLPSSTTSFLDLTEVHKILADVNTILSNTQFSTKLSNPCFLLTFLLCTICLPIAAWNILNLGARPDWAKKSLEQLDRSLEMNKLGGMTQAEQDEFEREYRKELAEEDEDELSSFSLFLGVLLLALSLALPLAVLLAGWGCRSSRRRRLQEYVGRRSRLGDGVAFRFGGGGGGGSYSNFNMALYDQKGLLVRGFLHVYVDPLERQTWCSQSGIPYVPPVPLGNQPPIGGAQPYQPPIGGAQPYQPPAGYSTVPTQPYQSYQPYRAKWGTSTSGEVHSAPVALSPQPPIGGDQAYQPPAGYSLIPSHPHQPASQPASQPYQPPPGFQLVPISNDQQV